MKAFQKAAGAARKRLFRRSIKEETSKMNAEVRTALVEDVTPATALQKELEEVEAEIAQARESLRQSEEKEIFLGQRSRQYRRALDEQARRLKDEQARLDLQQQQQQEEENGGGDEETLEQAELDRKMEKWERDEDALGAIVETHKKILGHCETMRWRIKELEAKRKACRSMITECTDFINAAEEVRNNINREAEEAAAMEDRKNKPAEGDPMIQIINEGAGSTSDDDDEVENGKRKDLDSEV
eukprot:scaffold34593_cov179-Amphora_coffeaeformis.AAC.4